MVLWKIFQWILSNIFSPSGTELLTQILPIPSSVLNIPGRDSSATHELIFESSNLPPFGYQSYFINKLSHNVHLSELDINSRNHSENVNNKV